MHRFRPRVLVPVLAVGLVAFGALAAWRHTLDGSIASTSVADIPKPVAAPPATVVTSLPAAAPGDSAAPRISYFEQPHALAAAPDTAAVDLQKRLACEQRLREVNATQGIEVLTRGSAHQEILFKSPSAGGVMAQEFLKAGVFNNLATNCAFHYITFVDGRYFSATWALPPSAAAEQQIAIIADREREEAASAERKRATAEALGRLMDIARKAAQEDEEIAACRRDYAGNAVAFEICRQGAISRAREH